MEQAQLMQRWRFHTRDTASRARDNQRRHRAKVKAHVSEVESQVGELRARLDEALAENSALRSRIEELTAGSGALTETPANTPAVRAGGRDGRHTFNSSTVKPSEEGDLDERRGLCSACHSRLVQTTQSSKDGFQSLERAHCEASTTTATETASESRRDTSTSSPAGIHPFPCCNDDSVFPPPRPGESTMPCQDAYSILEGQRRSGADMAGLERSLTPGFRRATVQSEGCRVQTNLVFSAIDRLT